MKREVFNTVKLGDRVGFVFEPGEFPRENQGTITAKTEDTWGLHVEVIMDRGIGGGTRGLVEGFTEAGVGCYRLERDEIREGICKIMQ